MPSIRSLLLLAFPLLSATRVHEPNDESSSDASDVIEWEATLKSLPSESLAAALENHLHSKYRDGIFEDGHSALTAVHSDDPELASKLVDEVKDGLRKRQNNNSTGIVTSITTTSTVSSSPESTGEAAPTESVPTSSEPPETSVAQTGILIPIPVTTTVDGSPVVSTSNVFQTEAPTSVDVPVTGTNEQGSIVVTSSRAPAAVISITNEQGSVETTAVPLSSVTVADGGSVVNSNAPPRVTSTNSEGAPYVLTSPTAGGVYAPTDADGRVVTVTYQPGGETVSQIRVRTTTLPNGVRSTITSYAEVGPPTSGAGAEAGSQPSSDPADLQGGAAVPSSWYAAKFALVVGAAIGVAGILL